MKKKKNIIKELSLDKIKIAKLNNLQSIMGGGPVQIGSRISPVDKSSSCSETHSTKTKPTDPSNTFMFM